MALWPTQCGAAVRARGPGGTGRILPVPAIPQALRQGFPSLGSRSRGTRPVQNPAGVGGGPVTVSRSFFGYVFRTFQERGTKVL